MASLGHGNDSGDLVTLTVCSDPNTSYLNENTDEVAISTAEISSWDLPSLLHRKSIKVEVSRNRLIEESPYFRGLLCGSFNEARDSAISICWDVESFVAVLRVIFGCRVEITLDNFISLNEAALFFGVDSLLSMCQAWWDEVILSEGGQSQQLPLDDLIHIWKFGSDRGYDFIVQLCTNYLSKNFMWAYSYNSYKDVPEKLLRSCIQHPDLTVDSEKHLCDVILSWIITNTTKLEGLSSYDLCCEIRPNLLPLWFAAGKRSCPLFTTFSVKATEAILSLARDPGTSLTGIFSEGDFSHLRLRLTKYTQKVDVSGCPQITQELFLISLLAPLGEELMFDNLVNGVRDQFLVSQALKHVLSFETVQELDMSNCPSLSLELVIDLFSKSFPSLQTLRAAYFLNFKIEWLYQLVQKFPLLNSVDLTWDSNPVIPAQLSIIATSRQQRPKSSPYIYSHEPATSLFSTTNPLLSNITKLNLVGRTDIINSDLLFISAICPSLNYVDIRGCVHVTDNGISDMIQKCKMLHSILACNTSFGNKSIMALSAVSSETQGARSTTHQLRVLHIGGCYRANGEKMSKLMSGANHLTSLCLKGIQQVDVALYDFSGTSLEILDVSDTEVSGAALSHVIRKNPCLKSLKARGCKHLLRQEDDAKERKFCNSPQEWCSELAKTCKLEEIEIGWGISFLSVEALKPALRTLRTLVVGLGGSLGDGGLKLIPSLCQMLETLILFFQVISDSALTGITRTLPHLKCLALCYCNGDLSSSSFKFRMPNLRILKLERVAPWMTNDELATLAENCVNLVELSLIRCSLLDSDAQTVISSGWPGLTTLHLEECGEITTSGVGSLLNCCALEDLTLRHTGRGIPRNFILDSAAKLPMLRKISLDVCDAKDGDFDLPSFSNRCFLSVVKIARCVMPKNPLGLRKVEARKASVHQETLVLEWNSQELTRVVVKERL